MAVILTIHGKDETKQVTKMTNVVLLDHKNKPLSTDKWLEKLYEIASTIAGKNYRGHKFEIT